MRKRMLTYTLSACHLGWSTAMTKVNLVLAGAAMVFAVGCLVLFRDLRDRKSTRLNSSHLVISYAGFCWKKKRLYYEKRARSRNGGHYQGRAVGAGGWILSSV